MYGAKITNRYFKVFKTGRMAFLMSRSHFVKNGGLLRNENPSVSSIKLCENHNDRKNKVSCTMFISAGLVDPKLYCNSTTTMGTRLIFLDNEKSSTCTTSCNNWR